jgi:hypothetical protein
MKGFVVALVEWSKTTLLITGTSGRGFRLPRALFGIITLTIAFGSAPSARHGSPLPVTVSLRDLVTNADIIFVGRVKESKELDGKEGAFGIFPTKETVFEVTLALKGELEEKKDFTTKEFAPLATFFNQGDRLMLFLPQASDAGFRSPGSSGYFRLIPRASHSGRMLAQNLVNNRGLWNSKLWSPEEFPQEIAQKILTDKYHLPKEAVEEILAIGDRPCQAKAIPLELLLAATQARLTATSGKAQR